MRVKYIGNNEEYDILHNESEYEVIEELRYQYVVKNETGGTRSLSKRKFEVVEE